VVTGVTSCISGGYGSGNHRRSGEEVPTATDDSNSQSQGRIEDDIYTHPTETHAQVQDSTADGTYQPSFAYYKDVVPVYSKPNSITPNRVQLQA